MTKKNIFLVLVLFVLSFFSLTQFANPSINAKAQSPETRVNPNRSVSKANSLVKLDRIPGKYIVTYKKDVTPDRQINSNATSLIQDKELLKNTFTFRSSSQSQNSQSVDQIEKSINTPEAIQKVIDDSNRDISEIKKNVNVESVEPDYIVHSDFTPNDSLYTGEWFLKNTAQAGGTAGKDIKAETAWDINKGSSAVVVAVIDSGVLISHPDLTNKIYRNASNQVIGYDFANNDADPTDDNGHGTHVAGTIAADTNNSLGVSGVCPNCKIMPIKFLDSTGSGATSDGISSINFAVANGAKVINNSWGSSSYSSALQSAIDNAYFSGVTVVASAGNNNTSAPNYPAAYNHVISVASTTPSDTKSSFSSYGSTVDISAPGSNILSTMIPNVSLSSGCSDASYLPDGDGYGYCSGTSMASPVVSGVAGLVVSQFPAFTPAQIENQLKNTVDNIDSLNSGYVGSLGTGRVNAYKALTTTPTPSLRYFYSTVSEISGNGNGVVDPGESIHIYPTVANDWGNATNVTGVLSSTNPDVTVLQPNGSFGNVTTILPGTADFTFKTNSNAATPQVLSLNLALAADGGYTKNVTITVDLLKPVTAPQTWAFTNDAQNWTISTGSLWNLTAPCYPAIPDKPAKYWHYGKTGCGTYDTSVANSGKLYSPAIAGTAGSNNNVVVSFDQFIETENYPSYDKAYIKAKIYGSDDSTATVLGGPFANSSNWQRKQYTIPQAIANSPVYQIFFDFDSVDSVSNNYQGWYIDNVNLTSTTANVSDVLVSEINWTGTPAAADDYFVELYNTTNNPIDLNSFTLKNIGLAGGTDFNISLSNCSNTVIQSKNYFLIANHGKQDAGTMLNVDPDCITSMDLSGSGKQITLVSHINTQIDKTPASNWVGGVNTSCLTVAATLPCYSISRDISKLDGTLAGSWYTSNQSLNMDSNYTYLNDTPVARTTWVANTVGSGEKMTPRASNGFTDPASQNSYTFCASNMHFNKATRVTDSGSLCPEVVSETNTGTQGYHISYGPYLSGLQLNQVYTATFRLRANLATNSTAKAASLDIVDGSYKTVGAASILENELTSGSYITKTITFTTQSSGNIEARTYINNDNLNFFIDQITFTKGGVAPTSWTYESESQPSSSPDGVIVSDPNASGQKAKSGKVDGFLLYGPYTKEQTGGSWYNVSYTIKRNSYTPSSPELSNIQLDAYNTGAYGQLGRKEIKFSDLTTAYQTYSFDFYKPDNNGTMEYRVKLNNSNNNPITIDKITVAKIASPVSFSRNIETELSPKRIGSEIKDGTTDVRSSNVLGFMSYGPYSNDLPTTSVSGYGNYSATFYVKNTGNKPGNIARIDVFNGNGANSKALAAKTIVATEVNNNTYTPITINFTRTDLGGSLEYRVQNLIDGNEIRIDKVVINKI